MRPEPARTIHVTFPCGYFVKEPDNTAWIIPRVPGILHNQLVSFKFVVTAHSQKFQIEHQTKAVKTILRIIGANAGDSTGENHGSNLCRLIKDSCDSGPLH